MLSTDRMTLCVCIFQTFPVLVMTFPEWLSGMEPSAHTRRCASVLFVFVAFCVHMYSFLQFDKADATADVQ